MTETDVTEWGMIPLPELLRVIGGIFDELHAAPPGFGNVTRKRAGCLRRALGEVHRRAAEVSPPVRIACSCGAAFGTADAMDQHFYDVFLPYDDIGRDGRVHVEVDADR